MKKVTVILGVMSLFLGLLGFSGLDYVQAAQADKASDARTQPEISFCGPWQKGSSKIPRHADFPLFAIPIPNILSRSGQPTLTGFRWLKNNGWKSVVDLRMSGEGGPVSNDSRIPGFKELNFHYLPLSITDGAVPSDAQAQEFLKFMKDPNNQPAHVHCRAGIGRTGVMLALYRFAIQGWPMEKAIQESRLFSGGVNELQKRWLEQWAQNHKSEKNIFSEMRR